MILKDTLSAQGKGTAGRQWAFACPEPFFQSISKIHFPFKPPVLLRRPLRAPVPKIDSIKRPEYSYRLPRINKKGFFS